MKKFLANDFSDPRWQRAASKNAFALLGRQRFGKLTIFLFLIKYYFPFFLKNQKKKLLCI